MPSSYPSLNSEREVPYGEGSMASQSSDSPRLPMPRALSVTRDGRPVPTLAWFPVKPPQGMVLVGHGGGGHKAVTGVTNLAEALLAAQCAVLAIDGPVHGDRRTDGSLDAALVRQEFRAAWRAGVGRLDIARDFSAALDVALTLPGLKDVPIGYIGVSMGTAYGIPLIAEELRIKAAAIGLWSSTYPASTHLLEYARQIRCAVWFTQQWHDEYFDRSGTAELFDAIGAADKRLVAYPGPHRELEGERLRDAVRFVVGRLGGDRVRISGVSHELAVDVK